jgi:hypothetical protein
LIIQAAKPKNCHRAFQVSGNAGFHGDNEKKSTLSWFPPVLADFHDLPLPPEFRRMSVSMYYFDVTGQHPVERDSLAPEGEKRNRACAETEVRKGAHRAKVALKLPKSCCGFVAPRGCVANKQPTMATMALLKEFPVVMGIGMVVRTLSRFTSLAAKLLGE